MADPSPAVGQTPAESDGFTNPDGRAIIALAADAAGGDLWLNPSTLTLIGRGRFYYGGTQASESVVDDYRMWRVFDAERSAAHGPSGKVRIDSRKDGALVFQVGFDGQTTWTQDGIVPADKAAEFWANSFGFGIIRRALDEGFTLTRLPDDAVDGHPCWFVRLEDPTGSQTLFGVDQQSHYIRYVGFDTPRGWHHRTYSRFERLDNGWVQPGLVKLFYDGVKANEIEWLETTVNAPLEPGLFAPPAK